MDELLHADMLDAARELVADNLRMDADTLFDRLGRWFPEATDEEVEAVVKEVL